MSNEQKDPKPEKTSEMIGLGLVIGAGLGLIIGIFFENITVGITFGSAIGLVTGAAVSLKNKKISVKGKPMSKNSQFVLWLALGLLIGVSLGIVLNNITIGVSLGFLFGMIIGGITLSKKIEK